MFNISGTVLINLNLFTGNCPSRPLLSFSYKGKHLKHFGVKLMSTEIQLNVFIAFYFFIT